MARILTIDDSVVFRIPIREFLVDYEVLEAVAGVTALLEKNNRKAV